MRYYLDTEFNGFGGEAISMALIPEIEGKSLYLARSCTNPTPWVKEKVLPNLQVEPLPMMIEQPWGHVINAYLGRDDVEIVADWPEDLSLFLKELIFKPGCHTGPSMQLRLIRQSELPNISVPGAVSHHAWWDALVLRGKVLSGQLCPILKPLL